MHSHIILQVQEMLMAVLRVQVDDALEIATSYSLDPDPMFKALWCRSAAKDAQAVQSALAHVKDSDW